MEARKKETPDAGLDPAHGVLTPARKDFYERSIAGQFTPAQYEALAQQFDAAGLPIQAKYLRARGNGRRGGREAIQKRREIYKKTMTLRDPLKVEQIAHIAREDLAHFKTAAQLEEYARGLREAATLGVNHAPNVRNMASPHTAVHGETNEPLVRGDGGSLASLGGHSDAHIGADGCLVESPGGGCAVGEKEDARDPWRHPRRRGEAGERPLRA